MIDPDARPRLAIYTSALGRGGAERALLNLANALVEQGVAVDMLIAKREQSDYLERLSAKVRVIDLRADPIVRGFWRLIRYLRRVKPLATLSFEAAAHPMLLATRAFLNHDIKCAATIQNYHSQEYQTGLSLRRRVALRAMSLSLRHMDTIVAVSQRVADDLVNHFRVPAGLVEVIHNPIITPEVARQASEAVSHPWLGSSGPPVIISVGRLTRQKNYPLLLAALARLRSRRDVRLIILGRGPEKERLEREALRLGVGDALSLPGFVDNPHAYVARATVFALSSDWEGLPAVLIEALALGCPVVSTDCPSGPREILDDGRYGFLVALGDEVAFANAIEAVLEGRRPDAELLKSRACEYDAQMLAGRYRETLFPEAW